MGSATPEAAAARTGPKLGYVAGVGPTPQRTIVKALSGEFDGRGGEILLFATDAGVYTLDPPLPNAIAIKIVDMVGKAHVVTGVFAVANTTITFGGDAGDYIILGALPDGTGWITDSSDGVTLS